MGYITICSRHKNEPVMTSFGEISFDNNCEAKLDSDLARELLKKYKPTFWAKKSGKPDVEVPPDPTEIEVKPKKGPKIPEDNFGFPDNVHVSRAAAAALSNGSMSADEVISERQKVLSNVDVPKRTLDEDLMDSGAAATNKVGGTIAKSVKPAEKVKSGKKKLKSKKG